MLLDGYKSLITQNCTYMDVLVTVLVLSLTWILDVFIGTFSGQTPRPKRQNTNRTKRIGVQMQEYKPSKEHWIGQRGPGVKLLSECN